MLPESYVKFPNSLPVPDINTKDIRRSSFRSKLEGPVCHLVVIPGILTQEEAKQADKEETLYLSGPQLS